MRRFRTWLRTLTSVERMQSSRADLGVAFQIPPLPVTTDDAHLMDVVTMLEHEAYAVMSKIVQVEIIDPQSDTRVVKYLGDMLWSDWENKITRFILPKENFK